VDLGVVPSKKDEGWADDEPQQVLTAKAESESSSDYEKVEHEDAIAK